MINDNAVEIGIIKCDESFLFTKQLSPNLSKKKKKNEEEKVKIIAQQNSHCNHF